MAGELRDSGDLRPGSAPGRADSAFDSLALPPPPSDRLAPPPRDPTGFSQDVSTVAATFFPGHREANHAVTIAGVLALARVGVGHWIDGSCADEEFIKGHSSVLTDLRDLSLTRLKAFVRENAVTIEAIAESLQQPPTASTPNLTVSQLGIAASLIHTERAIVRGLPFEALITEALTALDMARRLDAPLRAQWKELVRHMLRHGIDEIEARSEKAIPPEALAWQRQHPCAFLFPMFCLIDTPKTYLADVLDGSRLLATTAALPSVTEEGRQLGSEDAANLFGRTVAKVGAILPLLTKDRGNAPKTLSSLIDQVPLGDRLALIDILAADPLATELSRRLESYGLLNSATSYASWLIVHRERRVVAASGESVSLAKCLLDVATARPGIRPAIVSIVSWSDRLVEADLLAPVLTLIGSPLDPNMVQHRIISAGEALQRGASPAEAREIVERGPAPRGGVSMSERRDAREYTASVLSTPVQTILQERLAVTPELQGWVTGIFNGSEAHMEMRRCLRRLASMPPEVTPRLAAFLFEYGAEPRCREFFAAPSSFERLIRFLEAGRHEEIRGFKAWLRGSLVDEPIALQALRGFRAGPSFSSAAAEAEEAGKIPEHNELIFIPPGAYKRLVIVGGVYSHPKRAAIQEAAGEMPVLFISPDDDPRSIRQTLAKEDLVVINTTLNSHSTSERVRAQCRSNEITCILVRQSGYKAVARIAERLQR